jgi:uncharacterized membrane protein
MILIRVALVPFWRRLPPAQFREWFGDNAGRIGALMRPLGAAAAVAAAASATRDRSAAAVAAASSVLGVAAITLAVNEPANTRFAEPGELSDEETGSLLDRWVRWHDVRVILGLVGAVAAIRAAGRE